MDFSKHLFACSQLHIIHGESREVISPNQEKDLEKLSSKLVLSASEAEKLEKLRNKKARDGTPLFSKTAESLFVSLFFSKKYNKRIGLMKEKEEHEADGVPHLVRGIKSEEDGAKLLSQLDGVTYYKDKKVRNNEFFTGAFDRIDAPTIEEATKIVEIKIPFQLKEFYHQMGKALPKSAICEMQGYLDITGKEVGEIHFCLVTFPEETIKQQRLFWLAKMCADGVETEEFLEKWADIEDNMRFSDIPPNERVWSYRIERDENMIQDLRERVVAARDWLNNFEKTHKTATKLRWHHLF